MNPGYLDEDVALQGRPGGFPGQPGGSVVHCTTVNITNEPPKDHIVWSLCNFLYGNPLCLGLGALLFSVKARDRKLVGDLEAARHYSSTARYLNIWATVLISAIVLIVLIRVIVVVVEINEAYKRDSYYYSG